MDLIDRIPKSMIGAPGEGLEYASALLEVLAGIDSADGVFSKQHELGVFCIVRLAQDLVDYELKTCNFAAKERTK